MRFEFSLSLPENASVASSYQPASNALEVRFVRHAAYCVVFKVFVRRLKLLTDADAFQGKPKLKVIIDRLWNRPVTQKS